METSFRTSAPRGTGAVRRWAAAAGVAWAVVCVAGSGAMQRVQAQGATGVGTYVRGAGDAVGTTQGWTVQSGALQLDSAAGERGQWLRFGTSVSLPVEVRGMSQMPARDTASGLPDVVVPFRQRLQDFGVFAEFGVPLPARSERVTWVVFGGIRVLARTLRFTYGAPYDAEVYDEERGERTPYVPGALNVGLTAGVGAVVALGQWQVQPYVTLGSGAPDRQKSSPWNAYPAYVEGGLVVLRAHRW